MSSGGYHWDYYPGALSSSQVLVPATHLKIKHLQTAKLTDPQSTTYFLKRKTNKKYGRTNKTSLYHIWNYQKLSKMHFQSSKAWKVLTVSAPINDIYGCQIFTAEIWQHDGTSQEAPAIAASGPFYYNGLILIPAWISYHLPGKCGMKLLIHSLNFNGATVEKFRDEFHTTLYKECNYLSMPDLKSIHVSKRSHRWHVPLSLK